MTLGKVLSNVWRHLRTTFVPDHRRQLLELLRRQYAEETCDVVQLIQHTRRMHYPQFGERLWQLAREDQARLLWLREQILSLGGELPAIVCPPPRIGKNSWECLRLALEGEKRSCVTLLECIHQADRTDPTIAAELRRWRAQAKQHCDEIMSMLMKSDPSALPPPLTSHQERQRQQWLEQQKNAWLDHERARWEAEEQQESWAEGRGERELQWTAELPRRELEWVLHQKEQRVEEPEAVTESTSVHLKNRLTHRLCVSTLPAPQLTGIRTSDEIFQKRLVANGDSRQIRTTPFTRGSEMRTAGSE